MVHYNKVFKHRAGWDEQRQHNDKITYQYSVLCHLNISSSALLIMSVAQDSGNVSVHSHLKGGNLCKELVKIMYYAGAFDADEVKLSASFKFCSPFFLWYHATDLSMSYRNMYMLLVKIQGLFQDSYDQYYFPSTFQALETALSVFQHFSRIPEHCANPDYTSADRPGKDNTTDRSPRQNVRVRLQQTSQVKTPTPGSHFRTLIRSRSSETIGGGGGGVKDNLPGSYFSRPAKKLTKQ